MVRRYTRTDEYSLGTGEKALGCHWLSQCLLGLQFDGEPKTLAEPVPPLVGSSGILMGGNHQQHRSPRPVPAVPGRGAGGEGSAAGFSWINRSRMTTINRLFDQLKHCTEIVLVVIAGYPQHRVSCDERR
jgi:hypothetical protein